MTDPNAMPPVAAAVIVRDGMLLLVRRRVAEGSLSWQLPAGKVEPGESDAQAAEREAAEDTGVTVRAHQFLGERIHPATGRLMVYIACEHVAGEARVADADELDAVEWVPGERLSEVVPHGFYEPVQEYLETALAY